MYRIDNWINEGSGLIVELIKSQYINISTYRPLSGSPYVKLPAELKSPKKEVITIKSNDQKCFLWCHVRHINPVKIHPERITQNDKKLANDLDYDKVGFPVRLVNNKKDFLKYTSRPTHITQKISAKIYAAIYEIKTVLTPNKPFYVGFTVLELSKWLMYDFHCSFMKKHFDAELLFTDTDNLTYEIKSKDIYEEFLKHKHLFDFSNYPEDSKFFDQANKKVTGKMKDESKGKIIDEFVGLKSKMYSMVSDDGKESNTAKGVNIATEFNEFKDTLFNKKIIRLKMIKIQGKKT